MPASTRPAPGSRRRSPMHLAPLAAAAAALALLAAAPAGAFSIWSTGGASGLDPMDRALTTRSWSVQHSLVRFSRAGQWSSLDMDTPLAIRQSTPLSRLADNLHLAFPGLPRSGSVNAGTPGVPAVPEPAAALLFAGGAGAVALRLRRR